MSSDKRVKWCKPERNNLPFGDWIVSGKDQENKTVLLSRDEFLEQLEVSVNS